MSENFTIFRKRCPACNSTNCKIFYSGLSENSLVRDYLIKYYSNRIDLKYLKDYKYTLKECFDCGLIFQGEILNDFLMEKLYNEWIDPHHYANNLRKSKLSYFSSYAKEIMMIISYFKELPYNLHFFDFGMGVGYWNRMANAFGCNSYGYDISNKRIEVGDTRSFHVINFEQIQNYRFDFISIEQVFEHIPKPFETLAYLKKALKNNGLIKISVPNGNNIKKKFKMLNWADLDKIKKTFNAIAPLEHINCFNRKSIINMAEKLGLEVLQIPIGVQYANSIDWSCMRSAIRNLVKPVLTNILKKGTCLFFRKKIE